MTCRFPHPSSLLSTLLIASSICLAAPAMAQTSQGGYIERFDTRFDEMVQESDPGLQLAKYDRLSWGFSRVPTEYARQRLEQALAEVKNPLTQFRILNSLDTLRRELDDWTDGAGGMDGALGKQGCLTDARIVGPFSNDSMENFHATLPPETGESGPYEGKNGDIDWRVAPDFVNRCWLNLDIAVERDRDAVIFLASSIKSPKKQDARLLLGVSGSYKVWLNGKPVALRKDDMGAYVDSDSWKLPLKRGDNQLVIKLASSEGKGIDMLARITDKKLTPLNNLEITPAWSGKALESFDGFTLEPTSQGAGMMARALAKSEDPVKALHGADLLESVEQRNASTPWRDTADRLEADLKSGAITFDAEQMLLLASLFEERWKRVELREKTVEKYPEMHWARLNLGLTYDALGTTQGDLDARKMYETILAKSPGFLPAVIEMAYIWNEQNMHHKAFALLDPLATPEHLAHPKFARIYLSVLDALAYTRRARELRESLYSTRASTFRKMSTQTEELLRQGKLEEALELITTQRSRYPWSTNWTMQEVEVRRAMGDLDGAMAVLDKRLTQIPQDTETLRAQADLLIAQGKEQEAVAIFQQLLILDPQDEQLRAYVAHLQPDSNRFHEPWMIEDLKAIADAMEPGPFHASTLLQQKIMRVDESGLSQHVVQQAHRINTREGINDASIIRIPYQTNDERVDILSVRVIKPDGSISEDYDRWSSDNTRKGSTTYNDGGTITLRANNTEPGDIIEFRYRVRNTSSRNFRGDYFGDVEYVQETTPIGKYRYTVLYPDKIGPLYFRAPALTHERKDNELPEGAKLADNYKSVTFTLTQIPHAKTDPDQPGYTEVYDHIIVSNKETIDELGKWWWNLVEEQLIVDDNIRKTVTELTKGLKTDDEKVRAIHNYVVQNTRYLHVGLGIHGWKPYRTTTCFRNRYGDCKDKAALLKVMLEEAGVKANLVLVRTRRLGAVESYPASMNIFNHAIAYVPSMDLFLDGTAEFNGTRELTTMDQGAQALIIEDGGKSRWVTMPVDAPEVNTLKQELVVDLTGEEPVSTLTMVASGSNAVYYRSALEDPDRRDEVLAKQLAATYPGATLKRATYSDLKKLEQPVTITLTMTGGKILQGNKEDNPFLYPMATTKDLLGAYADKSKRDQDLMIRVPYVNQTTVRYKLPSDKIAGKVPQSKTLKSKFGSLDIEYNDDGKELTVQVRYSIDVQRVKVEDYEEFRAFMRDVTGTLNETIELK